MFPGWLGRITPAQHDDIFTQARKNILSSERDLVDRWSWRCVSATHNFNIIQVAKSEQLLSVGHCKLRPQHTILQPRF